MYRVLTVNPGSTSTKIGLYDEETPVFVTTLRHDSTVLQQFKRIADQYAFRRDTVLEALQAESIALGTLHAVVGRGGILPPLESGTYVVNQCMLDFLRNPSDREHASNLGALIASEIAGQVGIPAFIVDPVSVDEFEPIARVSGMPEIERRSLSHALNLKAAAYRAAKDLNKAYRDANLVVVHMGGGISVAPHKRGRMIDVNQALDGTGPFSPERAGGLPIGDVMRMAFSGQYTYDQMFRHLIGSGGLVAHLGTNDARVVEGRIAAGDEHARLVYSAMAYQIAKEIGAMATVLSGELDAIVLTGGLAYSDMLIDEISSRIRWIAPIMVYPGEDELLAMAQGGLRVLHGDEQARDFVV
jgi:butyrate kinase